MKRNSSSTIRIASRSSDLAMWQARHVAELLRRQNPELIVDIVEVTTTGDRVLSQPLRDFGGLGVFTREVQAALLDGRADVAVHSLKDLPTESHPELSLAGIPARGDTDDALILPQAASTGDSVAGICLPLGARVATGSPRRQAQLKRIRPDVSLVEVRGNVISRLNKLDSGEFDAMILACAGLIRLDREDRISQRLSAPLMYHAVGQGALGLECRADDDETRSRLANLTDPATWAAATAERELLFRLRAGCHAPVGVTTKVEADVLSLTGVVLTLDGSRCWMAEASGPAKDPQALGRQVAERLLQDGAFVGAENPV